LKEILLDSFEVDKIIKKVEILTEKKTNENDNKNEIEKKLEIKEEKNKENNEKKNNEINIENNDKKTTEKENNDENKIIDIRYNLTFKHIEIIENFLLKLKEKNKFIYDISVLILFHQSLPNNDEYMNCPLLPENYIKKLFDLRLIELMRIIMVFDSCSHSLFTGGNWIKEINKHINLLRNLFI
jgi:hypothetical protein